MNQAKGQFLANDRKWRRTWMYWAFFSICGLLTFFIFKFILWYKSLLENAMTPPR
jgi:hypothetical protein